MASRRPSTGASPDRTGFSSANETRAKDYCAGTFCPGVFERAVRSGLRILHSWLEALNCAGQHTLTESLQPKERRDLARSDGTIRMPQRIHAKVVIIGSGPAGYAA